MSRLRLTQEEVINRIKAKHGARIHLEGSYTGMLNKHWFRCCIRAHPKWQTTIASVIHNGSACPMCNIMHRSIYRNR